MLILKSNRSQLDQKFLELTSDFSNVFTNEIRKEINGDPHKDKTEVLSESEAPVIINSPIATDKNRFTVRKFL